MNSKENVEVSVYQNSKHLYRLIKTQASELSQHYDDICNHWVNLKQNPADETIKYKNHQDKHKKQKAAPDRLNSPSPRKFLPRPCQIGKFENYEFSDKICQIIDHEISKDLNKFTGYREKRNKHKWTKIINNMKTNEVIKGNKQFFLP